MPVYNFRKPHFPTQNLNIVWYLIALNALVFFVSALNRGFILNYFSMIPGAVLFVGHWWSVLTYMFVHVDPMHLVFNMLALFFIGTSIEERAGSIQFLIFYLIGGLFAGILSFLGYWYAGALMTPLVGASGAIYALLVAYACFFPTRYLYILGIFPVRAPYLVIAYAALDILLNFFGSSSNVAHLTHLSGLLFGIIAMYLVYKINFIDTLRP